MEGLPGINGKGLISFRGVYSSQTYPYQFLIYNDGDRVPVNNANCFCLYYLLVRTCG